MASINFDQWGMNLQYNHGTWEMKVQVGNANGQEQVIDPRDHTTLAAYHDIVHKTAHQMSHWAHMFEDMYSPNVPRITEPGHNAAAKRELVFTHEKLIGRGTFGHVYKVVDVNTKQPYAVKYFHLNEKNSNVGWFESVAQEIRILAKCSHNHIVCAVAWQFEPYPLLIMDYHPLGSVFRENLRQPFNLVETATLLFQGLKALEYLHSGAVDGKVVIHRDINPGNILVASRRPFWVKLADFGFAKDSPDLRTVFGTEGYVAPEVRAGLPYTTAVDIYALGAVVAEHTDRLRKGSSTSGVGNYSVAYTPYQRAARRLKHFVSAYMANANCHRRLSASSCLQLGHSLGLFANVPSFTEEVQQVALTTNGHNFRRRALTLTDLLQSEPGIEAGGSEPKAKSGAHAPSLPAAASHEISLSASRAIKTAGSTPETQSEAERSGGVPINHDIADSASVHRSTGSIAAPELYSTSGSGSNHTN